jgi:osmotically-inducible protein OsmY
MANRQQNYQSDMRRSGNTRPGEEDDNRSSRDWDEGEGSTRGDRQREAGEQGGPSGRYSGYGDFGRGDYNQRGRGDQGNYGEPNYSYGQPSYGQDFGSSGTSNYGRSGYGQRGYGRESEYSRSGSSFGEYGQQYGQPSGQFGSRGGSQGQGMHRGKGPKNFQRSDERVKELLCERLHDDPDIDASEITVNVQNGRITLEGTVDSRRTKMAVEDVAEQIGVQDVQNNLRVQKQGERGMEAGSRSSSATASSSLGKSSIGNEDSEQTKRRGN